MAKKRGVKKRNQYHNKLKEREKKIRANGNIVSMRKEDIVKVMDKHGFTDYRVNPWGSIDLKSKYDYWVIESDDSVVYLKHGNEKLIRIGNERSSYHLHNVFYDLDFCIKSIKEHDEFKSGRV